MSERGSREWQLLPGGQLRVGLRCKFPREDPCTGYTEGRRRSSTTAVATVAVAAGIEEGTAAGVAEAEVGRLRLSAEASTVTEKLSVAEEDVEAAAGRLTVVVVAGRQATVAAARPVVVAAAGVADAAVWHC